MHNFGHKVIHESHSAEVIDRGPREGRVPDPSSGYHADFREQGQIRNAYSELVRLFLIHVHQQYCTLIV